MQNLELLQTKVKLSVRSSASVFRSPKYIALAVIVAVLFFELTYWLFNLNILTKILGSSNVSLADKFHTLISPIEAISATDGSFQVTLMLLLSLLQGMLIALLIFVLRNQKRVDAQLVGGSTFAGFLAVIGLGCPSCGTSLVTPIVAIFVSGSSTAIAEDITNVALPISILVTLYALYIIGQRVANVKASSGGTIKIINKGV